MQRFSRLLLTVAVAIAAAPNAASAAGAPDLSIVRGGPRTVALGTTFLERLTVTNQGTAATPGIEIDYAPGGPTVSSGTPGLACTPILHGHSGRGGGYTRVGWKCTEALPGGLAPGASTPAAPSGVGAVQVGDQLDVSWTPDPATAQYLTSSLVTATPTSGSAWPALTAVVAGRAHFAGVPGVEPSTTYAVTVVNYDAGGAGPASAPILFSTPPSTVHPAAPAITYAYWTGSGTASNAVLVLRWAPKAPGDSPIDHYQVSAVSNNGDTTGSYGATVPGSTTEVVLPVDDTLDWSLRVRAHNAAGWGGWSAPVVVYALN